MPRTWRERVDRVKAILRGDGAGPQPDVSEILDDSLVETNLFSKEARQAARELERERTRRRVLPPTPSR